MEFASRDLWRIRTEFSVKKESCVQLEVFKRAVPSSCHTGRTKTTRMAFSKMQSLADTLEDAVAQ